MGHDTNYYTILNNEFPETLVEVDLTVSLSFPPVGHPSSKGNYNDERKEGFWTSQNDNMHARHYPNNLWCSS